MSVLKNCPFCGGDNFATAEAGQIHEVESVQCINSGCVIEGEWFRVDDWNNQPVVDKLTEALQPFADGYERARFESSWASYYTNIDAYGNAYKALKN